MKRADLTVGSVLAHARGTATWRDASPVLLLSTEPMETTIPRYSYGARDEFLRDVALPDGTTVQAYAQSWPTGVSLTGAQVLVSAVDPETGEPNGTRPFLAHPRELRGPWGEFQEERRVVRERAEQERRQRDQEKAASAARLQAARLRLANLVGPDASLREGGSRSWFVDAADLEALLTLAELAPRP